MKRKSHYFCKCPKDLTYQLLTVFTLMIPTLSYSKMVYNEGAWTFTSDDDFCKLKTLVKLSNGNRYTRRSAIVYFFYLDNFNKEKTCVNNSIPNRSIYTLIAPYSSREFKQGSSALLQSESLSNELTTLQHLPKNCSINNYYKPSHRVENLLISAIIADEKIKLSTDFEDHDNMSGVIDTNGFVETYSEFLTCIDNLQTKPNQFQERQNFKGIEYLKLTPLSHPYKPLQ